MHGDGSGIVATTFSIVRYENRSSFEGEKPASVLISYVGRGGEILSRNWPGTECLLTPQSVVRAFSRE
jgi:hypothetical protein